MKFRATMIVLGLAPLLSLGQVIIHTPITTNVVNPINSIRTIDWTQSGTSIPSINTQCVTAACNTVVAGPAGSITAAQINSAIASASSGTYVLLPAGTYSLSAQVNFANHSGVVLRGAGPDQTILQISAGATCTLANTALCFTGADASDGESCCVDNVADWQGNYSKGTTSITIGNQTIGATKPSIGTIIFLDQLVDAAGASARSSDTTPEVFECLTPAQCSQGTGDSPASARGTGTTSRGQFQIVQVTSISAGSAPWTVGISPAVGASNWCRDGGNCAATLPQAWWSSSAPLSSAGIENLTVQPTVSGLYAVGFRWARNCWMKNVAVITAAGIAMTRAVSVKLSTNITIRDSYFFDGANSGQDDYGVSCYTCAYTLVENNIFQHIRTFSVNEQGMGNVFLYNYFINPTFNGAVQMGINQNHGAGADFLLAEGNDGFGMEMEPTHGNAQFLTVYRNRLWGDYETSSAPNQTVPIYLYSLSRFANIIGNVLGKSGTHTNYQVLANDGSSQATCYASIYSLGIGAGGNCSHNFSDPDDNLTYQTIFRWGNWDVTHASNVNSSNDVAGNQFNNSEVPLGLAKYANQIPANNNLPSSLIYNSSPSYFGSTIWPPIGPDVTNGNITASGGHAYKIPARQCFESVMLGTFGDTSPKTFNASNCYPRP